MLLELFCFPLQDSFGGAGFSGSFRCALIKKYHGAQLLIDLLFRPERVLLDFLPIVRSFTPRAIASGHEIYLAEWPYLRYCTLFYLFRQAECAARPECQYV